MTNWRLLLKKRRMCSWNKRVQSWKVIVILSGDSDVLSVCSDLDEDDDYHLFVRSLSRLVPCISRK